MKTKYVTLALAACAIAGTSAANAAHAYWVNDGSAGNVLTYPAVVDSSTLGGACATTSGAGYAMPLSCAPLFGKHTYYDDGRGFRANEMVGYSTRRYDGGQMVGYMGSRYDGTRVNTFSAVMPNSCDGTSTTRVCGQKLSNSLFDIRLFGFGLGLGRVVPRWDMRPAGEAF